MTTEEVVRCVQIIRDSRSNTRRNGGTGKLSYIRHSTSTNCACNAFSKLGGSGRLWIVAARCAAGTICDTEEEGVSNDIPVTWSKDSATFLCLHKQDVRQVSKFQSIRHCEMNLEFLCYSILDTFFMATTKSSSCT